MNEYDKIGFVVKRNAIGKEAAKILSLEFNMLRNVFFKMNNIDTSTIGFANDAMVKNSFSYYGAYCFESLMQYLQPQVEDIVGKKLYPTYSYARIYYKTSTLLKHIDRVHSQYAVSITIDDDEEHRWPIWMKDLNGEDHELVLDIGDMCVYKGNTVYHWREEFKGRKQIQAFFFYTDDEKKKFDGRPMLGMSSDFRDKSYDIFNEQLLKGTYVYNIK